MNRSARHDYGSELQFDAELLELNGYGRESLARLDDGEGEFAACQETSLFAINSNQVRFGEDLEKVLSLQRLDNDPEIQIGTGDKNVEEIADANRRRRCGRGG